MSNCQQGGFQGFPPKKNYYFPEFGDKNLKRFHTLCISHIHSEYIVEFFFFKLE